MSNYGSIQLVGNARSDREVANGKRVKVHRTNDDGSMGAEITSFETTEDMVEMMEIKDEHGRSLYHQDPVFRETVKDIVANSPALMAEPTIARRSAIPSDQDFLASLKVDALRQRRERLVDAAGGDDLEAKYILASSMMNPEFAEGAAEMVAATEAPRPFEDSLKARQAAGLGPLTWTYPSGDESTVVKSQEELNAQPIDSDGYIIKVGE
jgi:hypothetical protein